MTPAAEIAKPPIISHSVLSVGDPVKNREKSELKDSDAWIP